jgi:hypothetical protein
MEELRAPTSGAAHAGHGESPPSGSGSGDGNDVSAFASPEFDPVAFLNRLFPDESSLAGVDPLVQKLRLRVRRVDDEILAAVRSQSTGGARAKADLAQAQSAIGSLEHRVADIKRKAETSEATVREICADVKKLDFAKKHLTSTITSLRRLSMLVNAVDQLERFASKRAYEESANLLDAANELAAHFERYSDVPKVAELKRRRDDCESALRAAVFEDFHVNWQPSVVASDASVAARLRDACAVVDALDPKHRDALTGDLTNKELTGYASVFDESTGAGPRDSKGLDQVERRYAWIKRNLKAKEAMWGVFPEHWRFPQLLCMSLCKLTRAHLAELLDAEARAAEVQTVLQAMHKTVAFERDLDDHFGVDPALGATLGRAALRSDAGSTVDGSNRSADEESAADAFGADSALGDDADAASAVRAKHAARRRESRLAEQKGGRALPMDSAAEALRDSALSFRDVVSSCFEDHLGGYVDMEERQLVEALERLASEETWGAEKRNDSTKSESDKSAVGQKSDPIGSSLQGFQSSIAARLGSGGDLAGASAGPGPGPGSGPAGAGLGSRNDSSGGFEPNAVSAVAGLASEGSGEVLGSAGAVFLNVKKVFKRCSGLTKGKPLLALHGAFSRVLRAYAAVLARNAEDAGSFLRDVKRVSSTKRDTTRTLHDSDTSRVAENIKKLCLIVNTAEWCRETVGPLGESTRRALNADRLRANVARDVEATEEAFASVAGDASALLVTGAETRAGLAIRIAATRWDLLETVGDQSAHVDACASALASAALVARRALRKNTFVFFCEKLAAAVAVSTYGAVLKARRVGDFGAQQLLLDTQSVKKLLLELPLAGDGVAFVETADPKSGGGVSRTHRRLVEREIGKCEALCKVLMSPLEGIRDTFVALLPEGSPEDFAAVCELKGMKKQDAAHAAQTLRAVRAAQGR